MIPAWVGPYIGLPYADKGRTRTGYDCWGLVRAALDEVAGITLPDYADAYATACDPHSVSQAVAAGLTDGWHAVPRGAPFDLLILRIAGRPWHCALMVAHGLFLHVPPPRADGMQILSCVERIDSPTWAKRIEGFYRHG